MAEHFISQEEAGLDLLACATFLAESVESSDGHAQAISAVVGRYLSKGNVDMAAELANTVDDPFTRDRLLVHVAEKCAEIDDRDYARQLIDAIEESQIRAEGLERLGMLEASKGNIEAARSIADSMEHPEFVEAAIASRQFTNGDYEAFATAIGQIEFPTARVSALTGVAHTLIDSGRANEAGKLLERAAGEAENIEHSEERIRSLIEVATLSIEADDSARAVTVLEKAMEFIEQLDSVHRDNFFAAVSVAFLRAGDQDRADAALDLVEDKTQIATCLLGHSQYYRTHERNNDGLDAVDEAEAILRSQRDAEIRSSKERFKLQGSIAAQFALFESYERAVETAEGILDEAERFGALSRIASIAATRGADVQMQMALNAISEEAHRAFAMIGVSDAAEKNGDRETALEHLRASHELFESVPQLASRGSGYNELARRYANYDDDTALDRAFHDSLETIAAMRSESSKALSLAELSALADELEIGVGPVEQEHLAKFAAAAVQG